MGERVILELEWDRPNSRFIARLIKPDHNTVAVQYMPYTGVDDSIPAVTPLRGVFLGTGVPYCLGTRPFIEMDTLWDNVTVDQ